MGPISALRRKGLTKIRMKHLWECATLSNGTQILCRFCSSILSNNVLEIFNQNKLWDSLTNTSNIQKCLCVSCSNTINSTWVMVEVRYYKKNHIKVRNTTIKHKDYVAQNKTPHRLNYEYDAGFSSKGPNMVCYIALYLG